MIGLWGRLWAFSRGYRAWMLLGVLLGFMTVGSGVGLMMASAYILSKAALHPSIAELQVGIMGVRFFGISRGLMRYLERLVAHDATFRLLTRARRWFYDTVEPLAPARLPDWSSGDLLERAVADVDSLQEFYIRVLKPPLIAVLSAAAAAALVGRWNGGAAAVLLVGLAAGGVLLPWITHRLGRRPGRQLVQVRAQLQALLVDQAQGLADLLAMGQAGPWRRRLDDCSRELVALQQRAARVAGLNEALLGLATYGTVIGVLVVTIPQVHTGLLDGLYLAVLVLGALAAFEAVGPLPESWQALEESTAAASRLLEVAETEPVLDEGGAEPAPVLGAPALALDHVCFSYDDRVPVLRDISLKIPDGSQVAIVGASGAGKSTLAHLLMRFWPLTSGSIQLRGQSLDELSAPAVRAQIGLLPQRVHLFAGTVRDNLLLARADASPAAQASACTRAGLGEWVEELPEGYDTWIGEGGEKLSDGQRQRLAVARLLLQDAPVLLLDEPTARLDALTEQAVQAMLTEAAVGRTAMTITHRLVGMERMDAIYVIHQGRLVESGTSAELLRVSGGHYRRLWDRQAQLQALGELDASAGSHTFSTEL
jgi:ATP-binding cassette, subfamily C, bacterial CydC